MMTHARSFQKPLIVVLAMVAIAIVVWFVICFFQSLPNDEGPMKKQVQKITVLQPPPPPPPKPKEEEPPEEKEEVKVEEEQPPEDIPEEVANDTPPGEQLGLDSDGGTGDDGFGLIAKKGGRGLLDNGGPFAWYEGILKSDIFEALNEEEELRKRSYEVKFRIWLDASGTIENVEIARSSGDAKIDKLLQQVIRSMAPVKKKPPLEMPQPVTLQIVSRL